MASTEPTGAPSSANPRVPSVRPRCRWTSGMWAVQDAKSSPWTTNTAVTAILGQRVAVTGVVLLSPVVLPVVVSPCVVLVCCARSDTVHLDTGGPQRRHGRLRGGVVGDDHVDVGQLADHRQRR